MIGIVSTEKRQGFFSSLSELPASKDMFVVLTAYAGSLTNDRYAWTVGFWKFFTWQILEILTDRPRKSAKKLSDFWKSLHVQSRVVVQWDFWEARFGFLCGETSWLKQETVWMIGIVSTEEKARIFSSLSELPALAEKDMFVVLTVYSMWVPWETLDTWTVGFRNLFYPTDPRNTDRLTKGNLRKKMSDLRKSLHVQRLGEVHESQGLVWFLEHPDFDDPGSEDLINEEWFWASGTRRARGMSEDGAGIRTRPIIVNTRSDTTVL